VLAVRRKSAMKSHQFHRCFGTSAVW
jgi:hypothetical protein